jgi:hypothetical protein
MADKRTPVWAGKNARVVFNLNDKEVAFNVRNWRIQRVGEWAEDDFSGELRTQSQFILKYYSITLEGAQVEIEALEALIDEQANCDANVVPFEGWVGFLISPNNGTKKNLLVSELSIGDWEMASPGRVDRNTMNIPLRAGDLRGLPSL